MADRQIEIKLILEAVNKAQGAFSDLKTQLDVVKGKTKDAETQTTRFADTVGDRLSLIKTHWLALSAAIVAAGFTAKKGWDLISEGARFEEQTIALDNLAKKYNTTAEEITDSLREVAQGQLSLRDATAIASRGLLQGLLPEQLEGLVNIARRVSDVTGTDIPEALDQMIRAMVTGRDVQLKLMGVNVDLSEALSRYGENLTETEKLQVAVNAVLADASRIHKELGEDIDSNADKIKRLTVDWENFKTGLSATALSVAVGVNTALDKMAAPMDRLIERLSSVKEATEEDLKRAGKSFEEQMAPKNQLDFTKAEAEFTALQVAIRKTRDVGTEALERIQDRAGKINFRQNQAQLDKLATSYKQFGEEVESTNLRVFNPDVAGGLPEYMKASSQQMDSVKKKFGEDFKEMNQFAIQAARNMENSFSDLFFNVLTGKMDSFRSVFSGFVNSMLRAISDMAAQMALSGLLGGQFGSTGKAGGLAGGLLKKIGFAEGGVVSGPITLLPKFQTGALVSQPTVGLFGEAGPEIISPIDKFFKFLHERDTAGGGITVNQSFNVSGQDSESLRRVLISMRPQLKRDAVEAVEEAINKGGSLARRVGAKS